MRKLDESTIIEALVRHLHTFVKQVEPIRAELEGVGGLDRACGLNEAMAPFP